MLTWVAIGVLLTAGLGLMVVSWNGSLSGSPSPSLMVLLWVCMVASGIYLFLLAVKKAHRLWVDEERRLSQSEASSPEPSSQAESKAKDTHTLDFAATARKLVRRFPEDASLEESGKALMKNLAGELEIMSGILYIRKKQQFEASVTYALASPTEPYSFKEGEGLSGQAARSQQIMVLTRLPEDHLKVYSGLGKSEPSYLAIVPLVHKQKTIAVLECSGYRYDSFAIENMFRIFARDLMEKLAPNLK